MSTVTPDPDKKTPDAASDDAAAVTAEPTPVYNEVVTDHPEAEQALAEGNADTDAPAEQHNADEPAALVEPTPLVEPRPPVDADRDVTSAAEAAPLPERITANDAVDESATTEAAPVDAPAEPAPARSHLAAELATPTPSYEPAPEVVAAPSPQTIYVQAPTPPRKKGNRGIGVLLAVAGAIVFAVFHAVITAIAYLASGRSFDIVSFFGSSAFLVPTFVFLGVFILAVLLINRAGWWAWVIGSLFVAVAVYFASIGIILLVGNVVAMTPSEANERFVELAMSTPLIIATLLAREISIWFGAAIAARGRKVKARNAEAQVAYERDLAENRRQYA